MAIRLGMHIQDEDAYEICDSLLAYCSIVWFGYGIDNDENKMDRWIFFPSFEVLGAICWMSACVILI